MYVGCSPTVGGTQPRALPLPLAGSGCFAGSLGPSVRGHPKRPKVRFVNGIEVDESDVRVDCNKANWNGLKRFVDPESRSWRIAAGDGNDHHGFQRVFVLIVSG